MTSFDPQNGTGPTYSTATAIGLSGITALSTGTNHACVVRSNGTVACWGANGQAQLGAGNFATIISGYIPSNGGVNSNSAPTTVQRYVIPATAPPTTVSLSGAVSVTSGASHNCALMNDATVKCWGSNNQGALGTASGSDSPWSSASIQSGAVSVPGLSGVTKLVSGKAFNCALLATGTVKCWGDNTYGQLGDSTKTQSKTPVTVLNGGGALGNVVAIAAGEAHACALISTGSASNAGDVKCWGANGNYGNLGNGSTSESLTATSTSQGLFFWQ